MVVGAEKRGLGGPLRAKEGTVESRPLPLAMDCELPEGRGCSQVLARSAASHAQ